MMSFGVRAGTMIANQELKAKPGNPRFGNGRHIGKLRQAPRCRDPDQPELAAAHQRRDGPEPLKANGIWPAATSVAAWVAPL